MSFKHGNFENEVQAWVNNVPLVTCHLFWVPGEASWRHQWRELCHMLRQLAAELRLKYFASKKNCVKKLSLGCQRLICLLHPKKLPISNGSPSNPYYQIYVGLSFLIDM